MKFDGEEHIVAANVLPTEGLSAEQIDDPKTVVRVYHGFGEPPYSWRAAGAVFGGLNAAAGGGRAATARLAAEMPEMPKG